MAASQTNYTNYQQALVDHEAKRAAESAAFDELTAKQAALAQAQVEADAAQAAYDAAKTETDIALTNTNDAHVAVR